MFPEVGSLLNSSVEWSVILKDITEDNNKVLGDKRNETVKFHIMERSMEEAVSIFHIVVEVEQRNDGPQKKQPLIENENPARSPNQEKGVDTVINRRKRIESQPKDVGVEAGVETCGGEGPHKRELYSQGRNYIGTHYHPPTRKYNFLSTLIMAWNGCS